MAASAFNLYNSAKKYLLNGTLDLDTDVVKGYLYKSTSNASTFTLSTLASVTNPVSGGGYTGAKQLTSIAITTGASAKQIKFDAADLVYTASSGNIGSACFLVIGESGGKLLCWSKLSTGAFTVTTGNTLTVQFNSAGIFTIA